MDVGRELARIGRARAWSHRRPGEAHGGVGQRPEVRRRLTGLLGAPSTSARAHAHRRLALAGS